MKRILLSTAIIALSTPVMAFEATPRDGGLPAVLQNGQNTMISAYRFVPTGPIGETQEMTPADEGVPSADPSQYEKQEAPDYRIRFRNPVSRAIPGTLQ